MNKKPSFFRQAGVLISRYFHIFVNNKQNLIMMVVIPLLTILIVSYVACPDMYAIKADNDHSVNDMYPVMNWEMVVQEKKSDDKDKDNELIGDEEIECDEWNGNSDYPVTPTEIDGEHYFLITNAEQIAFLGEAANNSDYYDYLTYNYLLQTDVDFAGKSVKPIGSEEHPFTGTFDGNGHTFKNMVIDATIDNVGLFGYVKSDETASADVTINDNDMVFRHNGIIKNLMVKDSSIKTTGSFVGGIVGTADGTSRVMSVCIKDTEITAEGNDVGGIVGRVLGDTAEVYSNYSKGVKLNVQGENIGGIVGNLGDARLSACYSSSEISFDGSGKEKSIGAVVGSVGDVEDQIKNVFYDTDADDNYEAVDNKDYKDYNVIGLEADDVKNCTASLIPFKGINNAYDIENPDEDLEDKLKDKDYDAEKDKDINPYYGFKKDGQIAQFYGTQVGIFMLVIVAIFVGVCNSIGEICKERNILKREYMTNLRLDSYVASKLAVQGVVCAIQMVIVMIVFFIFVHGKDLPSSGVIFPSVWIEYYISMFLLTFAADVMSLVISSIVKSASSANSLIPIVLIVQIVFCGVMFKLEGIMDYLSNVMISKWGICALAATTRLNDTQQIFLIENPSTQISMGSDMAIIDKLYDSTAIHLLIVWGVLIGFIALFSIICRVALMSVKNDKR